MTDHSLATFMRAAQRNAEQLDSIADTFESLGYPNNASTIRLALGQIFGALDDITESAGGLAQLDSVEG